MAKSSNWSTVWSVVGVVLGVAALGVTTWGIITSSSAIEGTSQSVGNTTLILDRLVPRVEMTWALASLSGEGWPSYIERTQRVAAIQDPPLVQRDVEKGMVLTAEGKQVLERANLWEPVEEELRKSPEAALNEVVLGLGIELLYIKADEQKITLDAMVGTTATLAQEILD